MNPMQHRHSVPILSSKQQPPKLKGATAKQLRLFFFFFALSATESMDQVFPRSFIAITNRFAGSREPKVDSWF